MEKGRALPLEVGFLPGIRWNALQWAIALKHKHNIRNISTVALTII